MNPFRKGIAIVLAGSLFAALVGTVAWPQGAVTLVQIIMGGTPISGSNPLPVSGSFSASLGGFPTVQTTGTPIAVTNASTSGNLPAGLVVVASNVGGTNGAYCKLGASATTSDQLIPPNSWFAFTVGANTQLSCITATSTTTINLVGGSGLPTGSGGGGGGGSSGVNSVTPTSSTALAANQIIKGSAGILYSFNVSADSTLSGAAWWIMVYNATSAPADGAVTPLKCYAMSSGTTSYASAFTAPIAANTGITIGVSTTGCFTKTASVHAFISGDAQ